MADNIQKGDNNEKEEKARHRYISRLVADEHLTHEDAAKMKTPDIRDMHDEHYPTVITRTRTGGAKGTGTETKQYTQVLGGPNKKKSMVLTNLGEQFAKTLSASMVPSRKPDEKTDLMKPKLTREGQSFADMCCGYMQKEKTITEPAEELIDEHKRLVGVLESPSHKDDKEEAKIQEKELEEYKEEAKKSAGGLPRSIRNYLKNPKLFSDKKGKTSLVSGQGKPHQDANRGLSVKETTDLQNETNESVKKIGPKGESSSHLTVPEKIRNYVEAKKPTFSAYIKGKELTPKDFEEAGKRAMAVRAAKERMKAESDPAYHSKRKELAVKKSMQNTWLADLGDKVKKIAEANKIPFVYNCRPSGSEVEHTFKVGGCSITYKTLGNDSKISFSQSKEADFRNVAIAKTLYYSIQRFHSGETIIRKSSTEEDILHPHEVKQKYPSGMMADKHRKTVAEAEKQGKKVKVYVNHHAFGSYVQHMEIHNEEAKKSELTPLGEQFLKAWTPWQQQEQSKQKLKNQKRRQRLKLGTKSKRPTKSIGEYRLRTQQRRMFGQEEHILGKANQPTHMMWDIYENMGGGEARVHGRISAPHSPGAIEQFKNKNPHLKDKNLRAWVISSSGHTPDVKKTDLPELKAGDQVYVHPDRKLDAPGAGDKKRLSTVIGHAHGAKYGHVIQIEHPIHGKLAMKPEYLIRKNASSGAYSPGDKVRTDSGEEGTVSHVQHSSEHPKYPHSYRVTDDKANDPYKQTRLEGGHYIPHNRLTRIKKTEYQITPLGEEFIKAFGLNTQRSSLKGTPGQTRRGFSGHGKFAAKPKKTVAGLVRPPSVGSGIPTTTPAIAAKSGTAPAVKAPMPKARTPKISSPSRLGK